MLPTSGCNIWLRTLVPCRNAPHLSYISSLCSPRSSPHLLHSAHCSGEADSETTSVPKTSSWLQVMEKWNSEGLALSLQLCLKTTFVSWSKVTDPLLVAWSTLPGVIPHADSSEFQEWQQLVCFGPGDHPTPLTLRHLPYQWSPTLPLLKIPRSSFKHQFMGSPRPIKLKFLGWLSRHWTRHWRIQMEEVLCSCETYSLKENRALIK